MRLPKQYSKMFEPYCTCCRKRWSFHLSKLVLVRNSLIQLSDTNRCAFWNCCAPQDAQSLLAFSLRECVRCAFLWPTIKLSPLLYCIIIIISVQVAAISLWGPCSEVSSFFCPFSPISVWLPLYARQTFVSTETDESLFGGCSLYDGQWHWKHCFCIWRLWGSSRTLDFVSSGTSKVDLTALDHALEKLHMVWLQVDWCQCGPLELAGLGSPAAEHRTNKAWLEETLNLNQRVELRGPAAVWSDETSILLHITGRTHNDWITLTDSWLFFWARSSKWLGWTRLNAPLRFPHLGRRSGASAEVFDRESPEAEPTKSRGTRKRTGSARWKDRGGRASSSAPLLCCGSKNNAFNQQKNYSLSKIACATLSFC